MSKKYSYKSSGVDYSKIDPLKILAQEAAKKTKKNLRSTGFREVSESRGESAFVIDAGSHCLASVVECLGTKSLVADEMRKVTGKTYYDSIAQDTIAMAVNDIISVGARPICINAYWSVGSSDWFKDEQRMKDLVSGWKNACDLSNVVWGGGETPCLNSIVEKNTIDLAVSCVGIIDPKERLTIGDKLCSGDAIILLQSSGIHANGVSLARKIAEELPDGYATKISDGRMYGDALLDPTIIYSSLIQKLFESNVDIHYMSNITGHGWRKIMRHSSELTYEIDKVPPVPPVLQFMQENAKLADKEAYGSLNMGAGFAVFVPNADVQKVLNLSEELGIAAYDAGEVLSGPKKVVIKPLGITFEGESLKLRE